MIKVFALLFSVLLAVASVGGYVFLDAKIITGEGRIADGQKEVDKGQPVLDKGKAELLTGKIALAQGKADYAEAHASLFMVFMDTSFNNGKGFDDGRHKIAEGDRQVALGEAMISAGEKKLAAGELALYQGKQQLKLARNVRTGCALSAIFFGVLSLALAIFWKRSLVRVFK